MSLPTFLKVLPAAFIALGAVAIFTSAANSSPVVSHSAVSVDRGNRRSCRHVGGYQIAGWKQEAPQEGTAFY